MHPAGFYKFAVHNSKELELLLMHNRKYAAEIAHNVSSLKRKAIVERAREVRPPFGSFTLQLYVYAMPQAMLVLECISVVWLEPNFFVLSRTIL